MATNLPGAKVNGDSGMRSLVNRFNWSNTPLGAIESWPEVLRLSVELCLNSRFPLILWWGPELTMLYNDSYVGHLQSKHPDALGKSGKLVWSEIWSVIGPMLDGVFSTGEATYSDDLLLFLERNGYPEETYHTFSYSAIKDSQGEIVGILTPVAETTERVIAERRQSTLRELGRSSSDSEKELLSKVSSVLSANLIDLPVCAFYAYNQESQSSKILATNADTKTVHSLLSPPLVNKLQESAVSGHPVTVTDLHTLISDLPLNEFGLAPTRAMLYPIPTHNESDWLILLAAVSPHQKLDERTLTFFESVASQIATALKDARAYEHERRKAEELQQLDQAKTAFFNNVSHEFRTPLTLMLGPVERLLTMVPNGESHAEIEVVQRNAMRLLKMVNSLLDFSRLEAGRYEGQFESTCNNGKRLRRSRDVGKNSFQSSLECI
ncbi:MAG: hypothetical protein HYX67_01865 [Candidatus Melainabacteria bacterium]|nr:hypothetical protein [Candidatus Melainabacteria bacterium]